MNQKFENDLKKTLDAAATRVDQGTRDELARRRREALDAAADSPRRGWLWLPVGGVVAAALMVALLLPRLSEMPDPMVADTGDIDMEILLAEESLDLYEDLEFYEWLDVIDDAG